MKEDYVSFEIAKLLKEKGFDEYYDHYYSYRTLKKAQLCEINSGEEYLKESEHCTAPTLQMAMKWLREVHNICIVIGCDICDSFEFYATIYIKGEDSWITCVDYEDDGSNNYKQVTEAAIKYCLENLI